MTRRKLVRRTLILCVHCARNLAYYDAGWHGKQPIFDLESEFLKSVNSNFLDIAVLEWCKLFGSRKEKHHWSRVVTDPDVFEKSLYKHLSCSAAEFRRIVDDVKTYRNRFVAHLGNEDVMHIPMLAKVRKSVAFLYDRLLADDGKEHAPEALATLQVSFWKSEAVRYYTAFSD